MISCRTLGPVEVLIDGNPAPGPLQWRKNLALFIYLARSPKHMRTRDHLVALLWPDKPQSAARHSLREAIRTLRQAAGESSVEVAGDTVALAAGAVELDVERFEALAAVRDWHAAAALVGGEFLEGFGVGDASGFEDWLTTERLAWRHRSIEALANAADLLLARGDTAGATDLAFRATALDPLSERGTTTVARCLVLSGDRASAVQQLERYAKLAGEAGVKVSDDFRPFSDRIMRQRTVPIPEYLQPRTAAGAESRRAPLVGRGHALEQCVAAWSTTRDNGTCGMALILGEPGTGKTRLLEELTSRARLDGAAVVQVRAVPADQPEPWTVVLGLAGGGLLDAPGVPGAAAPAIHVFARQLPAWAERFGRRELEADQLNPGRALVEVARAAAQEAPLVLAIDDAHWSDAESLAAVGGLARDLAKSPVHIVLAAAPYASRSELDELRARIGRDLTGVTVNLGPLGATETRELSRWALPEYDEDALDRLTRRVLVESAGLPLLLVELLHAVALGMELSPDAGVWPQPTKTLDQTLPGELPDPIVAATRVGFRRLSATAQQALTAIAALGDRADVDSVRAATGLAPDVLMPALDELEWQRWVTVTGRAYGVVAQITRAVILRDMLTPGQRERLLQAAEAQAS